MQVKIFSEDLVTFKKIYLHSALQFETWELTKTLSNLLLYTIFNLFLQSLQLKKITNTK